MAVRIIFILFCLGGGISLSGQNHPQISVVADKEGGRFGQVRVAYLQTVLSGSLTQIEDWRPLLHVHPIDSGEVNSTAMLGRYYLDQDTLFFQPRFPLQPNRSYQVILELPTLCRKLGKKIPRQGYAKRSEEVTLPVIYNYPRPRFTGVYPSTDTIPANQLKIYLEFDQPMQTANIYQYFQLINDRGHLVPAPFLELYPALWDSAGTRLTLWFDPGRIKTGLQPNQKMGPPLEAGHEYFLLIDPSWESQQGVPFAERKEIKWTVTAADRDRPDPTQWQTLSPEAGSKHPLEVHFPESLDYALLQSAVAVRKQDGQFLEGQITLEDQEKRWLFTPMKPWQAGVYHLRISADLEDLAGNNLNRLFDTNLELPQTNVNNASFLEIQFRIN